MYAPNKFGYVLECVISYYATHRQNSGHCKNAGHDVVCTKTVCFSLVHNYGQCVKSNKLIDIAKQNIVVNVINLLD